MKQKGFSAILILIVVTILALGGYMYYQKQNKVSISPTQQVTNYNTFTSKRVGFSFQYPLNWPLSVASDQDLKNFNNQYTEAILFDKSFYWNASDIPIGYIFVEKAGSNESIQTYAQKVNNDYEQLPVNIKQKSTKPVVSFTKVAGIDTVIVTDGGSTASFNSPNTTYVLFNSGFKYTLALQHSFEKNNFNQILSTFKFLDQNQVDTSNWKTYTNSKYGYLIKYPDNWVLGGSGPGQTSEFIAQHFWVQLNGPKNCEVTKHCGLIIIIVKQLDGTDLALSAKEIWLRDLTKDMRPVINKEEDIELGGIRTIKFTYINNFLNGQTSESTAPIPMKTIVLVHNKNLYEIDLREFLYLDGKVIDPKNANFPEWAYDSLYNQILSTFKFTQ